MQVLQDAYSIFVNSINSDQTKIQYEYSLRQFLKYCQIDLEKFLKLQQDEISSLIINYLLQRNISRPYKVVIFSAIKHCCELNDLTEKESLSFIERKLGTSISRRTYYEVKRALYQQKILKKTESFLTYLGSKNFRPLFPERTYINPDSELARNYSNIIKLDFIPESSYKVFSDASKTIGKSRSFFARLNRLRETSRINYESVPENATIRREYINCGIYSCRRCKHGPYYYAYWKTKVRDIKSILENMIPEIRIRYN